MTNVRFQLHLHTHDWGRPWWNKYSNAPVMVLKQHYGFEKNPWYYYCKACQCRLCAWTEWSWWWQRYLYVPLWHFLFSEKKILITISRHVCGDEKIGKGRTEKRSASSRKKNASRNSVYCSLLSCVQKKEWASSHHYHHSLHYHKVFPFSSFYF